MQIYKIIAVWATAFLTRLKSYLTIISIYETEIQNKEFIITHTQCLEEVRQEDSMGNRKHPSVLFVIKGHL